MEFGHKSGNSIQWYSNKNYKKCHGKRNGASKSKQRLVQHNGAENKRSIDVRSDPEYHSMSSVDPVVVKLLGASFENVYLNISSLWWISEFSSTEN